MAARGQRPKSQVPTFTWNTLYATKTKQATRAVHPYAHPPGHAQVDFGECVGVTRDPPTRPPIQKQAKSPQIPESRLRPGCETLTISAGADAARRALRPRSKLAWFYSAPLAGFYSAVDSPRRPAQRPWLAEGISRRPYGNG